MMNRTKQILSETFWQILEEMPYSKITEIGRAHV